MGRLVCKPSLLCRLREKVPEQFQDRLVMTAMKKRKNILRGVGPECILPLPKDLVMSSPECSQITDIFSSYPRRGEQRWIFCDINQQKVRLVENLCQNMAQRLKKRRLLLRHIVSARLEPIYTRACLGMTINAYTLMAFCASNDSSVRLSSKNYSGNVSFDLNEIPESTGSFWGSDGEPPPECVERGV